MSVNWAKAHRPFQQMWHWLTSMRTALILLFILAFAAIPGALLPQRSLNKDKVDQYLAANGTTGKIFDKLQLFDVFSSFWFIAVVVLLLISLVGCIIPRTIDHYKAMKTPPAKAPLRFFRLPHNDEAVVDMPVEEVSERVRQRLGKWFLTETPADQDRAKALSFSAEKGYLREFGNLVFHLGLAVLIVVVGWGSLTYYEGQVIMVTNTGTDIDDDGVKGAVGVPFCNTAAANYDSMRSGNTFDGTTLNPFCIQVEDFKADYLGNGQAKMFTSHIRYAEEEDMRKPVDQWKEKTLQVNHPLRIAGDRVYLQGHGFAPAFKVTWPNGESRTSIVQFRPDDPTFFLSSGAFRFDPPAGMYPDLFERRKNQIAIEGLFAPTAEFTGEKGALLQSSFPAMNDPAVAVDIYRGDAGLDTGRSQGLFSLDRELIHTGQLKKEDRVNLKMGETTELADGTKIEFLGAKEFVNLQISHDSTQIWVLGASIMSLIGMVLSLGIKRRRVWVRLHPTADGGTRAEFGGLARTDKAGWGDEFQDIVDDILDRDSDD
ncbi:cytochrome c biogenesis protein ResB [Corynebacterium lactis]|uniref:Cytochrome C biogenesis protein ResB n=1 Tax=Corynebacterium lactis RW2-5 TaxID=1408189 RepID=A0A0K2GXV1_9CORY|nr:cytochrome c biogenesis protein ResB [Corynebacterium lactis]ALA66620.1 cytochrome C biogenesis protein ResB [Corynebacterium lactis RW2-5]